MKKTTEKILFNTLAAIGEQITDLAEYLEEQEQEKVEEQVEEQDYKITMSAPQTVVDTLIQKEQRDRDAAFKTARPGTPFRSRTTNIYYVKADNSSDNVAYDSLVALHNGWVVFYDMVRDEAIIETTWQKVAEEAKYESFGEYQ